MKIKEKRKFNTIYGLDSEDPILITSKNLPTQSLEFEAKEARIEFLGIESIRILNDGEYTYGTTVEVKNNKGEWQLLGGVQSIEIKVSVDMPVPLVKIERYIIKESS